MLNRAFFGPFTGRVLVFLLFCGLVTGCGWFGKKVEPPQITPEVLYQKGVEAYQHADYMDALETFQKIKDQYPLSKVAVMAELGTADTLFSEKKYIEAEAAYSDFLNLHPANPNLAYVLYQMGLCHYKQIVSIDRDQTETLKARKEFEKLISTYPESQYAQMAEKILRDCRRRLAEHEFYIGHFYFKSKKYQAALKRFETIAREYPNLGLDFKVTYFLKETKRLIEQTEKKASEINKQQVTSYK
jgi:outer membrane protein assembly factor BamD